jgi:23S rRNA (guanine745-N1)-methyltransferase
MPLDTDATRYFCAAGHSFDVAKEGYVNLLPPHHRTRGIDGDVLEMVQARRRFLDGGFFDPLRDLIAERVEAALASRGQQGPATVLEVGSGDGFYVGGIGSRISPSGGVRFLGTDVSKTAVRLAARRHHQVLFFVSDVHRRLYVGDASIGVLLDVFAPRSPGEFARVLAPGGTALIVIPSPAHLASLRRAFGLLGIDDDKEGRTVASFAERFSIAGRDQLRFPLDLPAEAVRDLIEMGPNHWHSRTAEVVAGSKTEASFVILHLVRGAVD